MTLLLESHFHLCNDCAHVKGLGGKEEVGVGL